MVRGGFCGVWREKCVFEIVKFIWNKKLFDWTGVFNLQELSLNQRGWTFHAVGVEKMREKNSDWPGKNVVLSTK